MNGLLKPGDVLNNTYVIEELVGAGGTGEVYRATNRVSKRETAVKILKQEFAANEQFIDLMRREASVLHEIIDDAVVRYHDLLETDQGVVFLVMEFIKGQSLADRMAEGPVPADVLLQVARRVAQGLNAAHTKKAFHRDLSPDNIILKGNDPSRATLIDFGIAKDVRADARTVVGGGFAGKYEYAAPEQMDGRVDGRSDLYSLGMTLLACFRGRVPDLGGSYLEILKNKTIKPDIEDVPGQLQQVISKLLEPKPDDRFQTAQSVLDFLDGGGRVAPGYGTGTEDQAKSDISDFMDSAGAAPVSQTPPVVKDKTGGGGLGGIIAAVVIVAILGGAGWFFGLGPGKEMIFGPDLPVASPYRLKIEVAESGAAAMSGNAPSEEALAEMTATLNQALGSEASVKLDLASGMPNETWALAGPNIAGAAAALNFWTLELIGERAVLRGEASGDDVREQVEAAVETIARQSGLRVAMSIDVVKPPLTFDAIRRALKPHETCGGFDLSGGDGRALLPGEDLDVTGSVADPGDLDDVQDALSRILDGRRPNYEIEILNPTVCQAEEILPVENDGGIELLMTYGGRSGVNDTGIYTEGENPVIDVVADATETGFLYVFYVDLQGQVFHMLPHNSRPENAFEDIAEIRDGKRVVRVAYPVTEASRQKLGFEVIGPFGKNMVIAVLSERRLFPQMRPRAESIAAFTPALSRAMTLTRGYKRLTTRRLLETRQ